MNIILLVISANYCCLTNKSLITYICLCSMYHSDIPYNFIHFAHTLLRSAIFCSTPLLVWLESSNLGGQQTPWMVPTWSWRSVHCAVRLRHAWWTLGRRHEVHVRQQFWQPRSYPWHRWVEQTKFVTHCQSISKLESNLFRQAGDGSIS